MTDLSLTSHRSRLDSFLAWTVPLIAYIAIAIPVAWRQRFQINPDGIIYIRRAQMLLAGHYSDSISGYWSPGLSWCIAAVLKLAPHANPQNVVHLVLTAWGFVWVGACCAFLYTVAPNRPWPRLIGGLALTLVSLRLAVVWMAPDLLLCSFLMAYLCCWMWPKQGRWTPLLGGVFAGLGYLCKSYALPFFVLHFISTLAYRQLTVRPRPEWKRPLLFGFTGLAIFVVPWAGVLSYKYHKFTISMVYHHNHLNVAPASWLRSTPDFCVVPPDPYLCIWEGLDPGPRVDWSPWSTFPLFRHQVGIAVNHLWWIIAEVYQFDYIALALLAGIVALLPARWVWGRVRSAVSIWIVLTAAVYCFGFLAVAFETRYIVPILLPLGIALCFSEAQRLKWQWADLSAAAVFLIVGIITVWPYAVLNPPRPVFARVAEEMHKHHLTQLFSSSNNNSGVNVSWFLNKKIVLLPAQDDIQSIEQRLRAVGVENLLVWTDTRTEKRDPFPRKLIEHMRKTHHWRAVLRLKLDSARQVVVYRWIGP